MRERRGEGKKSDGQRKRKRRRKGNGKESDGKTKKEKKEIAMERTGRRKEDRVKQVKDRRRRRGMG